MIGLGVIGCGRAASEIARTAAMLSNLRIVAATDPDAASVAAFAERTGARVAANIDDVLADSTAAAVYVGTPHHLLAGIVERALGAGKHVLCEKPLALSAAQARRLGALADARALKLSVFFELRRSGPVEAARRLLRKNAIGTPRFVRIRTVIDKPLSYWGPPEARSWRGFLAQAGGGVLLMNTIHQLDALRYVTGLEYVSAQGEIDTFTAPAEVEDVVSASLRLSNGGLVSIVAAAHSPGAMEQETIEIDGEFGRLDLPSPGGSGGVRLYSKVDEAWTEIPAPQVDMHAAMVADFLRAVAAGVEVPAGAVDAARSLAAVNAVYRSAASRRPVRI